MKIGRREKRFAPTMRGKPHDISEALDGLREIIEQLRETSYAVESEPGLGLRGRGENDWPV